MQMVDMGSVQFSLVPRLIGPSGDMKDDSTETLFQSVLRAWARTSIVWDNIRPAFSLPTAAWPNLQGVMKNDSREAVMVRDIPESCERLSSVRCQKRFLWANKEVELATIWVNFL